MTTLRMIPGITYTRKNLEALTGMPDRANRHMIRAQRRQGVPIVALPEGGYKLAEEMNACDATIRREAELVGAPFRRGGRNEKMWQSKVAEWANANAVDIHTADAQSEEHAANDAPPKADKPQMGVKLLHARLEMSGDRETLLANLRVLMPDEGQVTVEW